jgi:hypothetical protein
LADLSITISNSVNTFGPAPSSKWGSMLWSNSGAGKWGEGSEDVATQAEKSFSESLTLSDSLTLSVTFYLSLAESITVTSETTDEVLQDGSGYSYVFVSNTADADDQDVPTYSEGSDPGSSWTSGSVASTTWS